MLSPNRPGIASSLKVPLSRTFATDMVFAVVAGLCVPLLGQSQPEQQPQAFEVASVKPNTSGDTNGMLRPLPGGRMTAANMPVRQLITFAYQVADFQGLAAPRGLPIATMSSPRWTGIRTSASCPVRTRPNPMQVALQRLLEDRFKLKVRRETREMDVSREAAVASASAACRPRPSRRRSWVRQDAWSSTARA